MRVEFVTGHPDGSIGQNSECIDLNSPRNAKKLIELLHRGNEGLQQTAYFMHESRRIGVRTQHLGEQDIKPSENPSWMTTE